MKSKYELMLDKAMRAAVHDFKIEGIVVSEEQQALAKKRLMNQISEEEYIRLVLEGVSEDSNE